MNNPWEGEKWMLIWKELEEAQLLYKMAATKYYPKAEWRKGYADGIKVTMSSLLNALKSDSMNEK